MGATRPIQSSQSYSNLHDADKKESKETLKYRKEIESYAMQLQGVMDHSGYDLPAPWDCFGMLPGFGGTKFHDEHHQYFQGNYAAALSVIDDVMGTRLQPRRPRGPTGLRADSGIHTDVKQQQ